MAFVTFVKELAGFDGRVRTTEPKALVSEKGVLSFNTPASKNILDCTLASVGWDKETRTIAIRCFKELPAGKKAEQFTELRTPKGTEKNPRPPSVVFVKVSSGLFGRWIDGNGPGYNYKAAGSQAFDCKVDAKTNTLSFVLPSETPAAKPKTARKPKDGVKGEVGSTQAEPETPAQGTLSEAA